MKCFEKLFKFENYHLLS